MEDHPPSSCLKPSDRGSREQLKCNTSTGVCKAQCSVLESPPENLQGYQDGWSFSEFVRAKEVWVSCEPDLDSGEKTPSLEDHLESEMIPAKWVAENFLREPSWPSGGAVANAQRKLERGGRGI